MHYGFVHDAPTVISCAFYVIILTESSGPMEQTVKPISARAPMSTHNVIELTIFSLSTAHDPSSLVFSRHRHLKTSMVHLGLHGWQLFSSESLNLYFLL